MYLFENLMKKNSNIVKRALRNANLRKKWRQGHDVDNLSKEYYS